MTGLLTSEKTKGFTESIIREMTRLAMAYNAVNLAQGFPDFQPPSPMLESAILAIRQGKNQYAVTWGTQNLRQAIAKKYLWYQNLSVDPETEITVTCGSTEAMIATLLALVNPGDEVIVFEPFYENYGPDTILSNASPRYVKLCQPQPLRSGIDFQKTSGTWTFDFDELEALFNNKTKAIIINTPNNPTGKVFVRKELEFIAQLCRKWNVIAITDEIYEHILYDGEEHISMATLPGMRELTVTVSAISKTYSATGWRVGWAVAPPGITGAIRKVHDFLTVGAPHPLQEGAAVALGLSGDYYEALAQDYGKRRKFLLETLLKAGFHCWKPYGAYYIMVDFSDFLKQRKSRIVFENDLDFAKWLVSEIGIAVVPGSSFYREPEFGKTKVRFSFGRKMEMLKEAESRLLA